MDNLQEKTPDNALDTASIKPVTDWETRLKENEKTAVSALPKEEPVTNPATADKTGKVPPGKDKKPTKKEGNFWSFILLLAFCTSAVCGVYLTMKP